MNAATTRPPPGSLAPTEFEHGPASPPEVLLAMADSQRSSWYARLLVQAGFRARNAVDADEARMEVVTQKPDVIVLAMDLPDVEGLGLLVRWRADATLMDVPIMILPPVDDYPTTMLKAIDRGADDVVPPAAEPFELVARARLLVRSRQRTARLRARVAYLERSRTELESAALRDPLTGAYNRRYLEHRLVEEVYRAQRHRHPLSVVMADVDHFKNINDRFGHAVGDCVLRGVASALRDAMRRSDVLVRYGGEEFVVVTPSTDLTGAKIFAERARGRLASTPMFTTTGSGIHATVPTTSSFGVASLPAGEGSESVRAAELLERADAALYVAKRSGRNRVCTTAVQP